jgi:DNA-binding protein HU-beta
LNTKDILSELKKRLELDEEKTNRLFDSTIQVIEKEILSNNIIALQGFGTFEVRKKEERISVNPTTKQRMLIPPKLTLAFKPSTVLKEKMKQTEENPND